MRFLLRDRDGGLKPMDAEQLRECAHKMVDFIADYYKNIESFPVLSQVQKFFLYPLRRVLTEPAFTWIIFSADVQNKILPGVTHWQSPEYFAYFPSNSSVAGFLGEMLSAGINMVGFSWITSPAATELEMIVLDWLAKALNLPDEFLSTGKGGGVIQGTASEAVLVVLLAARDKVLRRVGKDAIGKLVAYSSDQTHSALLKACKIAGIHPENCRVLKTDAFSEYALSPESLSGAISQDIASGLIPFFLCATVGTTSSTAVDPLPALGKISNDRSALIQSLSTNPEFLQNKASQGNMVVDYKDWQIPLGRRFRSLKLWMVLRLYGLENLQAYIRNHIELARKFEELVKLDPRFEVAARRTFSLVCFRLLPTDQNNLESANRLNRELLDAVNSTGKLFISHTVLSNKYVLRFAVGAPLTEERHVVAAWTTLQEKASELLRNSQE
ncbi:UNVERIFIED_CONTAM: Tyrosine decarboxylase 1 [Sesamum radiatum]|uniref:Tyrosine decarboxylase 1 n=1 Tax=Sesamum radiatum TaxID=300843 RepID=A0AAW2W115_SESRA